MKKLTGKYFFSGFTLIELLVVITIISILMAMGFTVYSFAVRQGRDSKRQSDLRAIQSALEQYYADQGFYPTGSGLDGDLGRETPPAFTSSTGNGNPSLPSPVKTYMNSLPKDPTETSPYKYDAIPTTPCLNDAIASRCTSYCLYAKLENAPSPIPDPPTGCTYPSGGYNFTVIPP